MKNKIRQLIPSFILDRLRRFKRKKRNEKIFTEIYRENKWGGEEGSFCSGAGSNEKTAAPYIAMVSEQASIEGFLGLNFVDLGCGDFRVGKQLLPLCSNYTGVDVVKPLIRKHQKQYGNSNTRFLYTDIVEDALPNGDVCFLRQVLQHLSNQQIGLILKKLRKYRWVFITEHYPTENEAIEPNLDKSSGGSVRVGKNSGVYLCKPPFELPEQAVKIVLEVPGAGLNSKGDPGVIRTFLYKPKG